MGLEWLQPGLPSGRPSLASRQGEISPGKSSCGELITISF
jgi:hypothetical protein